jgi:hypothetical protein
MRHRHETGRECSGRQPAALEQTRGFLCLGGPRHERRDHRRDTARENSAAAVALLENVGERRIRGGIRLGVFEGRACALEVVHFISPGAVAWTAAITENVCECRLTSA